MQIRDFKIIIFGSGLPGKKNTSPKWGLYIYIPEDPCMEYLPTLIPKVI